MLNVRKCKQLLIAQSGGVGFLKMNHNVYEDLNNLLGNVKWLK